MKSKTHLKLCSAIFKGLLISTLGVLTLGAHAQTNLAQNKITTVSSSIDVYVANNVVDGNQSTYWESINHAFPQSVTVDLGSSYNLDRLDLKLPSGWGSRTQVISVSGSVNGSSYSTLVSAADYQFMPDTGNTVSIGVAGASARYVRLNIDSNTGWPAAQISELEIYGDNQSSGRDAFTQIKAASFDSMNGIQTEPTSDSGGGINIGWIEDGDWIAFNNVDFGSGANKVTARVASNTAGGTIEMRLGGISGSLIGTIDVTSTGGWQNWQTKAANVSVEGEHDLFLVFTGSAAGGLFNINWLQFSADDNPALPAVPQNLHATGTSASSVFLAWNAAAGATGYRIQRDGNIVASDVTGTTYEDTGLIPVTSYSYNVIAYNQYGESAASNTISATTAEEGNGGGDDEWEPDGTHGAQVPYDRYDTEDASYGGGAQLNTAPNFPAVADGL